jgi:drug/metabolite transporter (DMT)-like permease
LAFKGRGLGVDREFKGTALVRIDTLLVLNFQLGILLAVLCALVTNLAFFFKQRGAKLAPAVQAAHPVHSARKLFGTPWFAIGMGVAVAAWLLHVAAMALAPLSIVQVVLAGGVVLVGVMADRMFGFTVNRRQWIGLALTAVGLAAFALTAPATHGAHASFSPTGMIAFEAVLCGLGAMLIVGPRAGAPRQHHGTMMGAASGILFGVSDIAIKALTGIVGAHGVLGLASPWFAVTIVASVVAFFASAKSLQDGDAVPVIAITGATANIASIAGGVLVFGDPMPSGALGLAVQALGILLVVIAAALAPSMSGGRGAAAPALAA